MKAEAEGRTNDARLCFIQAWERSQDDYDACIAAHYVARHQATAEETLRWNRESLERADLVHGDRVQDFYPSLYLNMGKSHEDIGNWDQAAQYYALAAAKTSCLAEERYGDIVRDAVQRGIERVELHRAGLAK